MTFGMPLRPLGSCPHVFRNLAPCMELAIPTSINADLGKLAPAFGASEISERLFMRSLCFTY